MSWINRWYDSKNKNASGRNYKNVQIPSSKFKIKIADVLKNEGYIIGYKIEENSEKNNMMMT